MLSYILTKTTEVLKSGTRALCHVILNFRPWVRQTEVFPQHPENWETLNQEESRASWARVSEFLALHGILVHGTPAYDAAPVPPLKPPCNSFCPAQDEDFVHRLKPGIPSKLPFFTHWVRSFLIVFNIGLELQRFQ